VLILAFAAACSRQHSILDPRTPSAGRAAAIGWLMFAVAGGVFALVISLLALALLRRRARPGEGVIPEEASGTRLVVLGGIALPTVVLLILSVLTVWALAREGDAPDLRVEAIGYQYWWEFRIPGPDGEPEVVTANELHLPIDRTVEIEVRSADVIHSFWVPELGGKRDLVPGHTNRLTWKIDTPGRYRGQCAEYCGLQHAQMAFFITAEPPGDFDAWLRTEAAPASAPSAAQQRDGLAAFLAQPCAGCHTIRGTGAHGTKGPDLTHLASRQTIGAGAAPNDTGHLGGWITNAQGVKPGSLMPPIPLSPQEELDILAYLQSLR